MKIVTSLFVLFASLESAIIEGVLKVLLIIELTTDLGKSFHETNFLMFISHSNLSVEQIQEARVTGLLIHAVWYVQCTKLVKLTYRPVFMSFRKFIIPWGTSFWNLSTAKCKLLTNLLPYQYVCVSLSIMCHQESVYKT